MKVLQICSFYAINKLYRNLFEDLNNIDIESDIYIPCKPKLIPNNIRNNEFYSSEYKNGDNIFEKIFNIFSQYEYYSKNNKIYSNMKEKINFKNYNFIHAHSLFENGYLAYKAKLEFGIDYIVAVRNTDVNGYFKRAIHLRKIGIEIMKNAKKVIFISPSYRELVLKKYVKKEEVSLLKNKCEVIPNGIDPFWFNSMVNKPRRIENNSEIKLIQACRIDNNKNLETSIKICKELRRSGINCYLSIVGDGPNKNNLIKKYGSLNYVKFYDKQAKEELSELYDNNHIFIMPSKYETFGLVYVEAM
ncbi:MAG: glycosyltransferase family 4 protein, partial [Clostridiales bacterium]|nr:glycosyltransferase family 4 protein [Clostridiales bacterium]